MMVNLEYYNPPLSKRASQLEGLWGQIASIWRPTEGFFQNFFRILSYLIPWVPGLGWGVSVLETIGSFFGYGLANLGALIDRVLGWGPSPQLSITEEAFSKNLSGTLSMLLAQKKSASNEEEMIKLSSFEGFTKIAGFLPKLIKLLWNAIKFVMLAYGFTKIGDIYSAVTGTSKMPGEIALEQVSDKKEEKKDKDKKDISIDPKALMGLVSDPKQLIQPFTESFTKII